MKKSLNGKMVLKKTTIASLEQKEMDTVNGGINYLTIFKCPYTMTVCGLYHCP